MVISILDFIKTGKLSTVQLGQSYLEIKKTFSKPDTVSRMSKGVYIWTYSSFEFHFFDGILNTLWCDNLSYLSKPKKKQFKWDYWILNKYPQPLTLRQFLSAAKENGIEYSLLSTFYSHKQDEGLPDNVILEVKGTDSIVYFENTDDKEISFIEDYSIIAIGSTKSKSTDKTYLI